MFNFFVYQIPNVKCQVGEKVYNLTPIHVSKFGLRNAALDNRMQLRALSLKLLQNLFAEMARFVLIHFFIKDDIFNFSKKFAFAFLLLDILFKQFCQKLFKNKIFHMLYIFVL